MRSSMTKLRFTKKKFEIELDSNKLKWFLYCLALRRYLSWIEGLTTNQNVIGSNPIRRTN